MKFTETKLNDAHIIDLEKHEDERGFFARSYCKKEFENFGIKIQTPQINVSYSKIKHTLRGLHFQIAPHEEAKLIRCTRGSIYDVIVDMRINSITYCDWVGTILSESNYRMMYVPEGFAHGFITLEDHTEVTYPVSNYYTPGAEKGIRWNDPLFNIDWPAEPKIISTKDDSWQDYRKTKERV